MELSTEEKILIEQRVTNDSKSMIAAYALWFFLGYFAVHRFYLGRVKSALLMLSFFILAAVLVGVGASANAGAVDGAQTQVGMAAMVASVALMSIAVLWVLLDAVLIPFMVGKQKDTLRRNLTAAALANRPPAVQAA